MARIVLADDGIEFNGRSPEAGPLGGVESAVVYLVRELAHRGHDVHVYNKCGAAEVVDGVHWVPIAEGLPAEADLYVANRGDKLIPGIPGAKRTVFWIHNPARYLMKWRYLSKLWRYKPAIVFIGDYHATTYPIWAPGGERIVIPYGIAPLFAGAGERSTPPPPRAVFTSNPLRSLDWLLDLWVGRIRPEVESGELYLFTGARTYGAVGERKSDPMEPILEKARSLDDHGVVLRGPVSKEELRSEFGEARAMLYRGDLNETFCLAVGEAQAAGVPAVVQRLGSVAERVIDGETGSVTGTDDEFVSAAVRLLSDDKLWLSQHRAALEKQSRWTWAHAAAAFEGLIPG